MSDSVPIEKREVRSEIRRRRRAFPLSMAVAESAAIVDACRGILAGLETTGRRPVASYLATSEEVDLGALHAWLWGNGRAVLLPRVLGPGRLAWHAVESSDQIHPGTLNLSEPDPLLVNEVELPAGVVMFVPGVAFTADGQRLGMGGGFYDRILDGLDGVTIGVGYSPQLVDRIPRESHDRPVDAVVIAGDIVRGLDR